MQYHDLESYKKNVSEKIQVLIAALARIAVGDFLQNVQIPPEEDEFTPLYVGVSTLIDIVQKQLGELSRVNEDLENKIRERTASLSEARHIAHVGSWHWEVRKNIITWSDELYAIYGLRPHEFKATFEGFLGRVHPDDASKVKDIIDRAYKEGGDFKFDYKIVRGDGQVRTLHAEGKIMRDSSGQAVEMFGTGQDITEQVEQQARLQKRDKVLHALGVFTKNTFQGTSWQKNIESLYKFLSEALGVDRIAIYQNTTDENKVTYTERITEWAKPGVTLRSSYAPHFGHFSFEQFDLKRWVDELSRGQAIANNIHALPREEGTFLAAQNVVSIIMVPLFSQGEWWGFMAFDECHSPREWDVVDIEATGTIADILGSAIEREQVQLRLSMRMLELEKLNKLMIGRELRMAELKEEIRKLTGRVVAP